MQLSKCKSKVVNNVNKFETKGLKMKTYLGLRDWTITCTPKVMVEKLKSNLKTPKMVVEIVNCCFV